MLCLLSGGAQWKKEIKFIRSVGNICAYQNEWNEWVLRISIFNQTLLAKQAWRLLNEPSCLLVKFLRNRYYAEKEFEDARIEQRSSFGWRSILFRKEVLDKSLNKMISNGRKTFVWASTWIDDGVRLRAPLMKNQLNDIDMRVSSL